MKKLAICLAVLVGSVFAVDSTEAGPVRRVVGAALRGGRNVVVRVANVRPGRVAVRVGRGTVRVIVGR